jgi:tetratricopeptide (TPR) repeat protein
VAIDRAATLKNAEKLLRQGKIEPAIAEYRRLVEDQPRDWNLANTLGDLYVRSAQVDKAIEQFTRIADSLSEEGFLPKASAIYKKILKLKPEDEHALLQAAEIAGSLGLLADARVYLTQIINRRQSRGDKRGAAQARIRLGSLDPADFDSRLLAANARVEIGDVPGATRDLKDIAAELLMKGRPADAIEALREAAGLTPDDDEIRQRLLDVYVASGDFTRARECASTPPQLKELAASLEAGGHEDAALEARREAARLDPEDGELRARLVRAFMARGDLQGAAEYLTVDTAGNDPDLLFTMAEIKLRGDTPEDGVAIVRRLLEEHPDRREQVALLGWTIGEQAPEQGFRVVELAADAAVAGQDWASAAAALQEFVTRVPNHVPALLRLVEICVDGGLEATMYSAQAQLADAYLASGQAAEARFIAEDLVAREPWDRSNIERFRRALELLGEPDPEALIAERLSGQSPFMTTDLFLDTDEFPSSAPGEAPMAAEPPPPQAPVAAAPPVPAPPVPAPPVPAPPVFAPPVPAPPPPPASVITEVEPDPWLEPRPPAKRAARPASRPAGSGDRSLFEISAHTIDLESILGELESPPAVAHASTESVEVDLSIVLDDIQPSQRGSGTPMSSGPPGAPRAAAPAAAPAPVSADLDGVFAHLRDDASRRTVMEEAERQYQRGLALRETGDIDECVVALEAASHAPRLRFVTASLLARILRDRGMNQQAVEWFERAAQAPAPTVEEGHDLLYDLADALEKGGEIARALAISLELQAEAGDYRDVAARIDRLTKVQARG